MRIYSKRKRKEKIKQNIQKLLLSALLVIGVMTVENHLVEYLKKAKWFIPKKVTFLNSNVDVAGVVEAAPDASIGSEVSVQTEILAEEESLSPSTPPAELIKKVFGKEADIALAVAQAESGMIVDRVGDTHLSKPSIGLFQISQIYHDYSTETLKNPIENVRIAKEIRDRGGWNRWTTYRTGEFRKFLTKK